jgi:hypothetical protein
MMKKLLSLLFVLGLALSACGPSQTQSAPPAQTSTPLLTPTATQTPIPPTATVTPLPTIPTFTPTFDVSTIVTVTPAIDETCPQTDSNVELDTTLFYAHKEKMFDDQIFKSILDYLNMGGSWEIINVELSNSNKYGRALGSIDEFDLTNDGVNEFIVKILPGFGIYSCRNGFYELSENLNGVVGEPASIVEIKDMNLNGVPEIVAGITFCSGHCFDIVILEWDGQAFQNLLGEWQTITSLEEKVIDVNNDGVFELAIEGPFPSMGGRVDYIPMRGQKDIYIWNGTNFAPSRPEFSSPKYRFQSIQDADMEVLDGHFDNALKFYNDAIFNKELKWWSKARREHEIQLLIDIYDPAKPTPQPEPPEDPAEYPRLAAYAYYRIMLLHLVQGQAAEAASTYQTLYETFGNDPYAAPYVEMASAFWEAYQSTEKMYDGCAAAIQYAVEHSEILIPLGSDYHGWQSHIYEPADVCPFR